MSVQTLLPVQFLSRIPKLCTEAQLPRRRVEGTADLDAHSRIVDGTHRIAHC